ncbi:hypothetical protein [uncultured Helicobacter sp.]|uniref:hypothetical protein n=1 Tax=uncultured Helicobacter sp. TaxID=175537 RepID=UPI002636C6E9|nr:hypothetical protein [uncultured Helicobacter sp.]
MSSVNAEIVSEEMDSFCEALKGLGNGAFLSEAIANLKKAMEVVSFEGKNASITLKLTIKPSDVENTINIIGTNSVCLPKPQIKSAFYVSEQMLPTRTQPKQIVLRRG